MDSTPRAGAGMIGQGDFSPALNQILTRALEKLSILDGLTVNECAARCVLVEMVPTFPAYSKEVCAAYAKPEGVTLGKLKTHSRAVDSRHAQGSELNTGPRALQFPPHQSPETKETRNQ